MYSLCQFEDQLWNSTLILELVVRFGAFEEFLLRLTVFL